MNENKSETERRFGSADGDSPCGEESDDVLSENIPEDSGEFSADPAADEPSGGEEPPAVSAADEEDAARGGAGDGATADERDDESADFAADACVAMVKKKYGKKRRLVTLAACLALVAAVLSVLFFACNAKEGVETRRPATSISICMTPPDDGTTPEDHTPLDNLGYIIGRLMARDCYHTDSSSVVTANAFGVEVRQDVAGGKDYSDGVLIATTFSRSDSSFAPEPVALQKFYGDGRAVLRKSVSDDPATWNGRNTEWDDGEPYEVLDRDTYTEKYGLWATEFSDYVLTEETVLSASEPAKDGDEYVMELSLDPATSTYYYASQMVTMGGLSGKPKFTYVNMTVRFTADWSVTRVSVSERYSASMGPFNATTLGETTIDYSYDPAAVDVSAYASYFSKYADADISEAEEERTATDYLAEGFGSVLADEKTAFDIEATVAGRKVNGRALLTMKDGSPVSVRFSLGGLDAELDLSDMTAYVRYKDFLGKLSVSDLMAALGMGGAGDFDILALFESAAGSATVERGDGVARVSMSIAFGDVSLPLTFDFAETEESVSWTAVSLSARLLGTDIFLSVTPGDADAAFAEIDRASATDLMPTIDSVIALAGGKADISVNYDGGDFSVTAAATVDFASSALSGSVTVAPDGKTPIVVTFAYSDGELRLAAGGIKVRADAGLWAEALLDLLVADMPEGAPDISGIIGALLDLNFDDIIKNLSLTENGIALTLDGGALLGAFLPDAGDVAGEITAAYDIALGSFTAEMFGVSVSIAATEETPVMPADEDYVLVSPDDIMGFVDSAKALASAEHLAISAYGTAVAGDIGTDITLCGSITLDGGLRVAIVASAGEDTLRLLYENGSLTFAVGNAGMKISEEDIGDMTDAFGKLFEGGAEGGIFSQLDIAALLADLRLLAAGDGSIAFTADLSSLLAGFGADAEVSYGDGGISAEGTVRFAGIMLQNAAASVAAGERTEVDFSDVTFCSNALEFVLEAYMRLADSEYISVALSLEKGGTTAELGGEVRLVRAESGIDLELSADAVVTADGAPYYLQLRLVGGSVYVYFSLVGFDESAYFPESVSADAQPLRVVFTLSSLADTAREVMPVIASLVGVGGGRGGFEFVADLLGGVHDAINSDIAGIKSAREWAEFIVGIFGGSFGSQSGGGSDVSGITIDAANSSLALTGAGLEVTLKAGGTHGVSAPASADAYTDFSSIADLAEVLMNSVTVPADGGNGELAELNDYYYLSGSATGSADLGSLGSIDLTSIGIAASVYVRDDFSVAVNARITVNYFIAVFNGDTVLDLTIDGGMVYMKRTQTSKGVLGIESQLDTPIVIYRAMTLDAFLDDMLNQISFMFNFSDTITGQLTGGGSGNGGSADIGAIIKSYSHAPSADGSESWVFVTDLSSFTDGVISDLTVTLGADAGGMLRSVHVGTKVASLLTLEASLGYVNPGADMDAGHASDVTQDVSGEAGDAFGGIVPESGYAEGYMSEVKYSVGGTIVGTQKFIRDGAGNILNALKLPDLAPYNDGGVTYSWGEIPTTASGDFILAADETPNVYTVTITSEYEIPDLTCVSSDGAYVYEISYTYGDKLTLPTGTESDGGMLLRYEDENGAPYITINGLTRDLGLTAVWAANGCVVTYTVLGEVYTKQVYAEGDALALPDCTVAGYEFVGWDTDAEFVGGDMTVEAILSVTVTLASEFAADGMTADVGEYTRAFTLTGSAEEDFAFSETSSSDGRNFFGWWHKTAAGWQNVASIAGLNGEKVYAAWISDLTVTITEAKKSSNFLGTWTINGSWTCGFDGAISSEIAASANVSVSASAWLKLSKDGSSDFDTLNSGNPYDATDGSFGDSGLNSAKDLANSAEYGGAKVSVTYSCGDLSLTLEQTAWKAK